MKRTNRLLVLLCAISAGFAAHAQTARIPASAARSRVGQRATVCGTVATARYAASTRGRPTFLNFDKAYPNEDFTVLIWGENRAKFGTPGNNYRGKQVCVSGKITTFRDTPEMIISDPAQITANTRSSADARSIPAGTTALCKDGTYSFSRHRRGTCSHRGGVREWLSN
jgi:hypothetical protein